MKLKMQKKKGLKIIKMTNIVYVYQEINDDCPFENMITKVYFNINKARKFLKQRVESFFDADWETCKTIINTDENNYFSNDFVCYNNGDCYYFWSINSNIVIE